MNVFIIFGIDGKPNENWFPWLKSELEKIGINVIVPEFPDTSNPNLDSWLDFFSKYENDIDENTILIGHSLGVSFILNYLEKTNKKINSAFLVAGFIGELGVEFEDKIKEFTHKKFDFEKIKKNCKKFVLYNSDNDPYVPLQKGLDLSQKLNSQLHIIKGAGHFNTSAGYNKFERLLEDIKKVL